MTEKNVVTVRVGGTNFEVPPEYDIQEMVGKGTYGTVCSAKLQAEDGVQDVAVKKIDDAFEPQSFGFMRRKLRELRILRHLRHENVVSILSVFLPGEKETYKEVYVVSELMETDLTSILKSNQFLSDDHFQFFIYQIFRGLKYIHSAGIIHRDLKPRNLLVNANCDLKICDFGLAHIKLDKDVEIAPATQYVCTRWYRAPEVLCSWTKYTASIDTWSAGCIFAEMLGGGPLFPGMSTQHQLQLLAHVMGTPSPEVVAKLPNEKCISFLGTFQACEPKLMKEILPKASELALDLLSQILVFDPDARCSVEDALKTKFLEPLHNPEDEPTRGPLDPSNFTFETQKHEDLAAVLRNEFYEEMLAYNPEKKDA